MKLVSIHTPANWREIEHHPLSELIGFGVGIDLEGLAADIQNRGYDNNEPIVLFEKKILDGRHRRAGAVMADHDGPPFVEFEGSHEEALGYVLKKVLRQHLDKSQLSMIGVEAARYKRGRPVQESEKTPRKQGGKNPEYYGISAAEAAKLVGVSESLIEKAKVVKEQGTPELQQAVKDKTVTVTDAAKVAQQPKPVQNKAVDAVKSGEAKTASAAADLLAKLCDRCKRMGKPCCDACRAKVNTSPRTAPSSNGTPLLKDDHGKAIPKHLLGIFQAGELMKRAAVSAERTAALLRDAEASVAFLLLEKIAKREAKRESRSHSWPMYSTHCKTAALRFHSFRPSLVCPECLGGPTSDENDPCDHCQDKGWLTEEETKRDLH